MICLKNKFCLILAIAILGFCKGHEQTSTPPQMPPLYAADDYYECLQKPATAFCMVYAELQPDENSSLWQYLWNYQNSYRYKYRHDQLYRGVCSSKCSKHMQNEYDDDSWNGNMSTLQPQSDNVEMAKILHAISRKQKSISQYELQMHKCVNEEIQQKYNLSVKTFVKYCDNPQEPIEKGPWYTYTVIVLYVICGLNVISSLYDFFLKLKQSGNITLRGNEYYDTKPKNPVHRYFTAFSWYRNYRRLVVPNNSPMGQDLCFIDGLRIFLSIAVAFEHASFTHSQHIQDTELFEKHYTLTFVHALMYMMTCIEIFFILSGIMLYIKFQKGEYVTPHSDFKHCAKVFGRMLISRYFRLMPSVILLMLISSNVLIHLSNAPFWRLIVEPNTVLCRNEWWSNVFMTSDINPNKSCWIHTWYVSGDFQLYAIFLAILILTAKYPQYKKLIYSVIGTIGLIVPSIVSYVLKLESISSVAVEQYRHVYLKDIETGIHLYLRPYANLNAFFLGLVCGELYMTYLRHEKYRQIWRRYLFKSLPLLGWLTIFAIWFLGTKVLFAKPSIWTALFVILYKHVCVAIVGIIVILFNMCHPGGFLTRPVFRPLARISYQIYLWHFIIIFAMIAKNHTLGKSEWIKTSGTLGISYLWAIVISFFIATMLEYPMSELLSFVDLKKERKKKKKS